MAQRGQDHGDPADPVAGWSRLHGEDVSGSRVVVGWLRLVHVIARIRLVSAVHPDIWSLAGIVSGGGAVAAAWSGKLWPLVALVLVILTGVLDGLDGAVALRTGRARPLGAVVDAVADRVTDLCLVLVLLALGAGPWWCAGLAAAVMLHEYARARAQGVGMTSAGAITVAERPTRIIIVVIACGGASFAPAGTPGTGWSWGTVSAVLWLGCSLIGGIHLATGIRRALTGQPLPGSRGPDELGDDRR
ncbi:MAG: CDP-alcohol phosphatidyltransferase family protein [Kibdelosporangium sp.]